MKESMIERHRQFLDQEALSCSMDFGCVRRNMSIGCGKKALLLMR